MATTLAYAIKFVGNMGEAVRFHGEQLGLKLRFQSPEWSEFDTGSTTLADLTANGVASVQVPTDLHGQKIAKMRDPDGAEFSVGGR